jgi:transcriptional regulator with XRE-family HTH domain
MEQKRSRKEEASCGNRGISLPHLKALRKSKALSQKDVSELSGVSRETIYRLEGSQRAAYPSTVRKLAFALGVPPEEVIRGLRRR